MEEKPRLFAITKILILILLCYFCGGVESKPDEEESKTQSNSELIPFPKLSFGQSFDSTEKDGIGNDDKPLWEFIQNGSGIISRVKATLEIFCVASYPIQWIIIGHIFPPEFVEMRPNEVTILNETERLFKLKMILFFNSLDECYSSASIACQKISDPGITSSIEIYVPKDNGTLLGFDHLNSDNLIPCPSTDPTLLVELNQRQANGELNMIKNAEYNPLKGFILSFEDLNAEGDVICSASDGSQIVIPINPINNSEISLSPKRAFIDEDLILKCPSFDKINAEEEINYRQNGSSIILSSSKPLNGTIFCRNETQLNFEFIKPPKLYLNNFEQEAHCLLDSDSNSKKLERSIATVRCKNSNNCEYMRDCLGNSSSCNFQRIKQFYSVIPARCWVESKKIGTWCASLPFYYSNGLVECTVQGLKRQWEFFLGLDYLRYFNWKDAPKEALIRMNQIKSDNATNFNSFLCEANAFLFADSIAFSIEFQNGTKTLLNESLYSHPQGEDLRKINEFNILGILKIELPSKAAAIHCHAPWWNSTETLNTELKL